MFDRFPRRIMVAATNTNGVMLLNAMYNNNFCISICVEHVNLYQHFACQPQTFSCIFIIIIIIIIMIAHTNTSVLMTYLFETTSYFIAT